MNTKKFTTLVGLALALFFSPLSAKITGTKKDFEYTFGGAYKSEMFFGHNISLLNNCNPSDKVWYMRHILDLDLDVVYGQETYDKKVAEMYFTMRNKSVWGDPESIASTDTRTISSLEVVDGAHRHSLKRHIYWIRAAWLKLHLPTVMGLSMGYDHTFELGLFPFSLGRGIAFGDAFAVGPGLFGFYTDGEVDQYAPGLLLSGDLAPGHLSYDLYGSLLQNNAASLGKTAAKIRGQEIGRLRNPTRGFGKIDYIVAGRLNWRVFDRENIGKLDLEAYTMYNDDPEQKVEFRADAESKLITVGFAGEYTGDLVEVGFDSAFNIGRQHVKSWDRNVIKRENRNGVQVLINSHVENIKNRGQQNEVVQKALYTGAQSAVQNLVNESALRAAHTCPVSDLNGQDLGTSPGKLIAGICDGDTIGTVVGTNVNAMAPDYDLRNASNRFRQGYKNTYHGWMIVGDAAFWAYKKDLQFAITAGVASGDANPNEEDIDGSYGGFIGLQELYSGKRVKSAFVLGGQGRIKRPIAGPNSNRVQGGNVIAQTVSGLTNLVFTGAGTTWKPAWSTHKLSLNSNVLFYWQEHASKKFDKVTVKRIDEDADKFLGTELNLFFNIFPVESLKFYFVGSVFFPGFHYHDVEGVPLNSEQLKFLDRRDKTGFTADHVPTLGHDVAVAGNVGLEFKF